MDGIKKYPLIYKGGVVVEDAKFSKTSFKN